MFRQLRDPTLRTLRKVPSFLGIVLGWLLTSQTRVIRGVGRPTLSALRTRTQTSVTTQVRTLSALKTRTQTIRTLSALRTRTQTQTSVRNPECPKDQDSDHKNSECPKDQDSDPHKNLECSKDPVDPDLQDQGSESPVVQTVEANVDIEAADTHNTDLGGPIEHPLKNPEPPDGTARAR